MFFVLQVCHLQACVRVCVWLCRWRVRLSVLVWLLYPSLTSCSVFSECCVSRKLSVLCLYLSLVSWMAAMCMLCFSRWCLSVCILFARPLMLCCSMFRFVMVCIGWLGGGVGGSIVRGEGHGEVAGERGCGTLWDRVCCCCVGWVVVGMGVVGWEEEGPVRGEVLEEWSWE